MPMKLSGTFGDIFDFSDLYKFVRNCAQQIIIIDKSSKYVRGHFRGHCHFLAFGDIRGHRGHEIVKTIEIKG